MTEVIVELTNRRGRTLDSVIFKRGDVLFGVRENLNDGETATGRWLARAGLQDSSTIIRSAVRNMAVVVAPNTSHYLHIPVRSRLTGDRQTLSTKRCRACIRGTNRITCPQCKGARQASIWEKQRGFRVLRYLSAACGRCDGAGTLSVECRVCRGTGISSSRSVALIEAELDFPRRFRAGP